MKLATHVKPISYLKAHAAEMLRELREVGEPFVITQNGEAKAVLQDIQSYEEIQETLALLKILALANREFETGETVPAAEAVRKLRQRVQSRK